MTDDLYVPRSERHVLRVFALDMTPEEVRQIRNLPPDSDPIEEADPVLRHADPAELAALFGLTDIDPAQVELIDTADLTGLGLSAYLVEADEAAADRIEADRERLDALRGFVIAATSAAFPQRPVTLRLQPVLRLVGRYAEEVPQVRFEPLPKASAQGTVVSPLTAASDRRYWNILSLIGSIALILLLLAVLFDYATR